MSVSLVAREAGVTGSQLFQSRKAYTEKSLVAVGANEPVVPASALQDAITRIKQLEAALGRKTSENDTLKDAVDFAKVKKVDCALTAVARGRPMRLVCSTLGVARSRLVALLKRPDDWIDRRTARSLSDDTPLLEDVRQVIHSFGTYCYRRVGVVLRHQHPRTNGQAPNHKRVYRVMRAHGLLLHRRGQRHVATRRHDGRVDVDSSNTRWCSDGFELACDNGERVRVAFALDCCDRES